jgi:phosphatidylglycerol---prolipoprotein diacylglyceryl transferase
VHPVLFKIGSLTIYTYGFCIALGAILGFLYMSRQSKKLFGLGFEQSNNLFLLLMVAGIVGGKFFMLFEDPKLYLSHPSKFFSGSGFVFYGSLLFCIPSMLWFFKKHRIPTLAMLDVMAVVTCIVHGFGRIGCFMAGCCYGLETSSFLGVTFTDVACSADPLNTPLHPTQLYEASFIFLLMITLLVLGRSKAFEGQLFLIYLIVYAIGRGVIELFRGDTNRGFVIEGILSNSQFISLLIISVAIFFHVKLKRKANLV